MFICIAGKNNIAVDVLEYLLNQGIDSDNLGVICNKNETGQNGWQKSFRFFAQRYGIKEYRLEEVYSMDDLVFISLEFDQIVKPELFKDARLYNIHFSLLPMYKGMYTSALPILQGEKEVGVTFHKIDRGIDTGDIIKQKKFELEQTDTCRDLYAKYIKHGTKLVLECIGAVLDDTVVATPQPVEGATYYSKKSIDYSNLSIDLRQTASGIDRQLRAFHFREYQLPEVYGKRIIASRFTDIKSAKKPGAILLENESSFMLSTIDYNIVLYFDRLEELLIACKNGDMETVVKICTVQEHINSANSNGWTPLIVAVYNNQIEIANYLIMHGADIRVRNNNGTNLLMYAKDAYFNTKDITLFKLLYELGLDIEEKDYSGRKLADYVEEEAFKVMMSQI